MKIIKTLNDFNMKSKKPWEVEGVEWKEVPFIDKIKLIKGTKPKTTSKQEGALPYLTTEYFRKRMIKEYVQVEENNKMTLVQNEDLVIIADGSRSGELFFCDTKGVLVSTMAKFVINEKEIDKKYIFWLLTTHFKYLNKSKYAAIPHVNKNYLQNLKIPIPFRNGKPDLETQKKIVEYIEANFSRIDKILEKKKKELEQLDELWESILAQAFKPKKGEEWKEVKLGDAFNIESGNRPKGGVKKYVEGIPSIGGEHLNYDGTFSFERLRYVPNIFYKKANKGKIKKYDILIVKDGATTGKTAFVTEQFPFEQAMVNEHVFLCRVKNNKICPNFVFRFLTSKEGQHRILKTKSGTAQGGINKQFSKLVEIPIPFRNGEPDIEKQKEIANYLDSIYEKNKLLKEKIQNQITHLEEMKESILDDVFNHDSKCQ